MSHALKFHAVVSGKTLRLPDLSAFEGKRVEVTVIEEVARGDGADATPGPRPLGLYRTRFSVTEDFDSPLPPEVQSSFEGDSDE